MRWIFFTLVSLLHKYCFNLTNLTSRGDSILKEVAFQYYSNPATTQQDILNHL